MPNSPAQIRQIVATRREGGLGRSLHDVIVLTQRNLLLDRRNPAVILGATAFPIFLMVIFTAGFSRVVVPGGNYADYAQFLVPLSVLQGLLFSTVSLGVALYNDLDTGMDTRLRTLPIARSTVIASRILGGFGRLFIQAIAIVLVGHFLGFRFQAGILATLGFLLLAPLFAISFAWIAMLIAVRVTAPESVQISMNPWLLPLTFLSIGYVPLEGFPEWLQPFVQLNPVSSAAQALRGLSSGIPATQQILITLAWSLAITIVFGFLAIRSYQHRSA
ncbi:MAG: ABC transporter permease [Desertifilum sp.]|nr:ABC transporter permease [Desertifilum sp.]